MDDLSRDHAIAAAVTDASASAKVGLEIAGADDNGEQATVPLEGCQIVGRLALRRVPTNLHITGHELPGCVVVVVVWCACAQCCHCVCRRGCGVLKVVSHATRWVIARCLHAAVCPLPSPRTSHHRRRRRRRHHRLPTNRHTSPTQVLVQR